GGAIESVTTQRGVIRTEQVICAAGAWSAKIGEMAGHTLPVVPVRRMIGLTTQMPQAHPTVPFTLDLSTTMYMHNYYSGIVLAISHPQGPNVKRNYSSEWLCAFNSAAAAFAPSLRNPQLDSGWAGFYENTPDRNAIIGASESVSGFYYC